MKGIKKVAKALRIIVFVFLLVRWVAIVASVIFGVLLFGLVGTSDFYTLELHQADPTPFVDYVRYFLLMVAMGGVAWVSNKIITSVAMDYEDICKFMNNFYRNRRNNNER